MRSKRDYDVADMRDYPQTLRTNCAAAILAGHLYEARCAAFGPANGKWSELPHNLRRAYEEIATRMLQAIQPSQLAEARSDALFEFASFLARKQFKVVKP